VMDIAALRALSLLRRGFFSGTGVVCGTDFDFCASRLGTLMLAVSVLLAFRSDCCSPLIFGGLSLLFFGGGPAIDVSAMLVFRRGGGGGKSGRLCDWYSGAV
jgi:hypothetical protein